MLKYTICSSENNQPENITTQIKTICTKTKSGKQPACASCGLINGLLIPRSGEASRLFPVLLYRRDGDVQLLGPRGSRRNCSLFFCTPEVLMLQVLCFG